MGHFNKISNPPALLRVIQQPAIASLNSITRIDIIMQNDGIYVSRKSTTLTTLPKNLFWHQIGIMNAVHAPT